MRRVILYAVGLIAVAFVIAAAAAFFLGALTLTLSKENSYSFFGNLLLNVVAEILGLAFGIFLAAKIASELARNKLKKLAPKLVELIANLREKTISQEAARSSVICAVRIISEDYFNPDQSRKSEPGEAKQCWVCNLPAQTKGSAGDLSCALCGLSGNVWNDPKLIAIGKRIAASAEESQDTTEGTNG